MTPAGHLLSGFLVGDRVAAGATERRRILTGALIGSIAPDFDVPLGLLGGWAGAGAHRGATHSLLGAMVMASMVAVLLRGPRRLVFAAAFGGILTHIVGDWLNPWGVRPLWPWMRSFRGNLVHEGDLYVTVILLAASVLAWRSRRRAALAVLTIALPAYLLVELVWRGHARELATAELAGRRVAAYPTSRLTCGWIVLSASETEMAVHCVPSPLSSHLRPALQVAIRDDFFIRASARDPVVQDFREKIPFSFAEVRPAENGGALVIWRDLRVAHGERPGDTPTGIHVRLDSAGTILSASHRWWLAFW